MHPKHNTAHASGWITDVLDSLVRTRALQHFLATGTLVAHSDLTCVRRALPPS